VKSLVYSDYGLETTLTALVLGGINAMRKYVNKERYLQMDT
jgi:hypothetical protein